MEDTYVQQATGTRLALARKVALISGFIGAGAIAAAMFVSGDGSGGGGGVPVVGKRIADVVTAQSPVHSTAPAHIKLMMWGRGTRLGNPALSSLGTLDSQPDFSVLWTDGNQDSRGTWPFAIEVSDAYGSLNGGHAAAMLTVDEPVSGQPGVTAAFDVCLPYRLHGSTTVARYWVDGSGGTYYDEKFLSPAFAGCAAVRSRTLVVRDLTAAGMNVNGPTEPVPSVAFTRHGVTLGTLDGTTNVFSDGQTVAAGDVSLTPLQLTLSTASTTELVVMPRVVTVTADGRTRPLCIPFVLLQPQGSVSYFFDSAGTPYDDSLLQQRSITGSCPQLLSSGARPSGVSGAELSQPFDPHPVVPTAHPSLHLRRAGLELGTLDAVTNEFTSGATVPANSGESPLALVIDGGSDPTQEISSRALTVTVPTGDPGSPSGSLTLCLPTMWISSTPMIPLYYDQLGRPYATSLLEGQIPCTIPAKQ